MSFLRRHRLTLGVGGILVIAGAAWLAFGWFEVQALWIDDEVDEAAPVFESGAAVDPPEQTDAGPTPATEPTPVVRSIASGQFTGRTHPSRGNVQVLTDGSPQRFLRFTQFETDNGPDVDVYLSTAAPDAEEQSLDDDYINLGDMKGNVGDQNYEIPPDVDLARYRTVVLWCVRFSVSFGTAPLTPA